MRLHTRLRTPGVLCVTHTRAHTPWVSHTRTFIQQFVPRSHNTDDTGARAHTQVLDQPPLGASLALRRWELGGESRPLATCGPLSHADDPWLTPRASLALLAPKSMGWGQGSTAHTHRTCALAPLIPGPRPARATATRGLEQGSAESQVSSCLDGGGEQDRAEQPPPQAHCGLVSGLRLRQSPPPWP